MATEIHLANIEGYAACGRNLAAQVVDNGRFCAKQLSNTSRQGPRKCVTAATRK